MTQTLIDDRTNGQKWLNTLMRAALFLGVLVPVIVGVTVGLAKAGIAVSDVDLSEATTPDPEPPPEPQQTVQMERSQLDHETSVARSPTSREL